MRMNNYFGVGMSPMELSDPLRIVKFTILSTGKWVPNRQRCDVFELDVEV